MPWTRCCRAQGRDPGAILAGVARGGTTHGPESGWVPMDWCRGTLQAADLLDEESTQTYPNPAVERSS